MASTLSIENINLNGDILTASNGSLYINNNLVKNSSGIQITDRYFIKGYSPISFYSRWPQQGEYLNEVFLGDFFQATGVLVTCSQPTTGNQNFFGAFYERPSSSAINTTQFAGFQLKPFEIYQLSAIDRKIDNDKIIGLNIYNAPADMRSISVNLLGYFSAAGKFDRMPKQINFYTKHLPINASGIHEEYSQWDSRYTGFGIYCGNTGVDKLTFIEPVTGYISGVLKENPKYYILNNLISGPCSICEKDINRSGFSGYFLGNKKINFPTKEYFSGFSGQFEFSNISGYEYSGFKTLADNTVSEGVYSGYDNIKFGGSGEIFQEIGWRMGIFPEIISGFLSGYVDPYGVFTRFSQITTGISGSGTFYRERFEPYNKLDTDFFLLDRSGYMVGYSGYFISGIKYFFP